MLYLLKPDGSTGSVDFLDKQLVDEHEGIDFSKVEWEPHDRTLDAETLDLALRYGYVVPQGIAVDAADLGALDHLRLLLSIDPDNNRLSDKPSRPLMESILGSEYTKHTIELDDKVKQGHERSIEEARKDLAEALETPQRVDLVGHWRALGGATF